MGHWATGLFGALWLDQTGRLTSPSAQGADFALWSVEAFGCYEVLHHRTLGVSPCFLVEVDRMTATGFGARTPKSSSALWLGLGAGVRGRWALSGRLAIALEVDGVVPTARQRFSIDGSPEGTVFTTSPIAARAQFGPEVRF